MAEDYRGRYWRREHRPGAGPSTLARSCTNPDCLWSVVLVRRGTGWWWEHDEDPGELVTGGPFDSWQDAADAAVAAGHAHPTRM